MNKYVEDCLKIGNGTVRNVVPLSKNKLKMLERDLRLNDVEFHKTMDSFEYCFEEVSDELREKNKSFSLVDFSNEYDYYAYMSHDRLIPVGNYYFFEYAPPSGHSEKYPFGEEHIYVVFEEDGPVTFRYENFPFWNRDIMEDTGSLYEAFIKIKDANLLKSFLDGIESNPEVAGTFLSNEEIQNLKERYKNVKIAFDNKVKENAVIQAEKEEKLQEAIDRMNEELEMD